MVNEGLTQLLLFTMAPLDHWVQLVRQAATANNVVLTVMDPDDVKQAAKNQLFHIAVIDSSTVTETTTLIATLRSLPAAKRIVVVTTALGWRQARAVYQAGAYDYRFKSYDVQELEQMIKNFFKLDEAGESNTEVPES